MDDQSLQTAQQQADNDALASAVAAASAHLGSLDGVSMGDEHQHHFHHHALQQPDFSHIKEDHHSNDGLSHIHHGDPSNELNVDVNVHGLEIPVQVDDGSHMHHHHDQHMGGMEGEPELDLGLGSIGTPNEFDPKYNDESDFDNARAGSFGRPPSIRKACDLCHAAKQKCSGDRPSCTRCAAGGWNCIYAPRQRRRTVPKDQKMAQQHLDPMQQHGMSHGAPSHGGKKRKLGARESLSTFGSEAMDMKMAMGMAMDMGLTGEEEGEEMQTMSDDQMLESVAIDGYLADLPLATFVHNLPFTAPPPPEPQVHYNNDDFPSAGDNPFPNTDMDQHTTSALRDAIFSLNENNGGGHGDGAVEGDHGGDGQGEGHEMDPHLALLNLTQMQDDTDNTNNDPTGLQIPDYSTPVHSGCNHRQLVPHILSLLTQHTLDPKPGTNTPLTLGVFAPLARSLRLFHSLNVCPSCSTSPQQTLPQLALLSRTTTILTFPYPPIISSSVGSSAQITIHGARLSGTGLSEAIEQHIVGVVWDSWRASMREIFAVLDKKAQDVITASSTQNNQQQNSNNGNGNAENGVNGQSNGNGGSANGNGTPQPSTPSPPQPVASSLEKQRAGLIFQAVSRLSNAMVEVEA
ncbi:hypothetical protein I302_108025 [Kwoniella bestiolae CBS 10118]|uniref:Zn(2)-C6 fungal-type domain-containing protein n=1 Tax=Kwoniella bestiolae CBS 10118 TaxID=1296100 RepID=A0A1B9FWV2_9TREE|nr:hypothetical protein I302_07609 [Kwoniella bestiolae CBS 10118]OCF23255.1 hypothetical protein I302_07609 [Kwoniella bestiolae CBS 10118]